MINTTNLERYSGLALLFLRIGVALIFITAGWGKLTGIEDIQGFFGNVGVPLPALMAWVVAIVEFFGGIMVLLGIYIRIPAVLLACIMLGALLFVKLGAGWGDMRIDVILLMTNLALFIMGSGRISVDHMIGKKSAV